MSEINLKAIFEKYDNEFLKFERIESPLNRRPDLCAFLLLDNIVPPRPNRIGGLNDMVRAAEHDEIFLDVDVDKLAELATEEQIRDLIRCGVRFATDIDSLALFV